MNQVYITRSQAQAIIEALRVMMASGSGSFEDLEHVLRVNGVPPLEPCQGEAHSDAFIDNCGRCAPRWGWTGAFVRVR